jgi:hypothetical protein
MGKPVATMSTTEKIGESMQRSLHLLPQDAQAVVRQMLSPASLAIIAGTLVVWTGSQFFGVGEIVDLILLAVGALTVGFSVFEGGYELLKFAKGAVRAKTDPDLDEAAAHFARAVIVLGIAAVQAVLMKGPARTVAERGMPKVQPRIEVGEPPPPGSDLRLSRISIPDGTLGITDEYGEIIVSRDQSLTEQRITLYHELVHRFFSPKTGPLRRLRAEANISGYMKSALLRYLEEALAEGYGQLKVNGLAEGFKAYKFPLAGGNPYVTVAQLKAEGVLIGTISLGGAAFYVTISNQPWGQQ